MAVRRPALLATGYYLLLGLLLVLVVTRALPHLLPAGVARHVGSDSEGYLLALLLPAWLQLVRPRLSGRTAARATTAAAAALLGVFLVLDLLGTLLWTGLLAAAGYAFGRSAVDVAEAISRYGLWIALAITVAIVAMTTTGSSAHSGAMRKNGLSTADGSRINSAPCPK